jgi:hypothetical protein
LLSTAVLAGMCSVTPAQSIERTPEGVVRVQPVKIDDTLKNPVTPEYEAAFWERANVIIKSVTRNADGSFKKPGNNTYFENEKRTYPAAMFAAVAGNEKVGLDILQSEDDQANGDNKHTLGIDLFPAFTLKGQMRKYFFFGDQLKPDYKDRMKKAFAVWTKTDPRATPHPVYQKFNGKIEGWGPNRFGNRQVDSRNTDNLRAMRDISIYLFAEEAGNQETMAAVKKDIIFYVNTLYTVGMGEWDSDTYHCHTVAPYLCLYDFAKDPEMKRVAKAALDHLFTAAAIKYYRGTFVGPSKRDYGYSYKPMPSSPFAKFFALYFGQAENMAGATESDLIHAITSNYRPPAAVIALAEKNFTRPVEMLNAKPLYENWKDGGRDRPGYFETMYFGQTFQMGSLASRSGDGDTGPFRLVAFNSKRDTDVINFSSRPKFHEKFGGDQIGQYRNLLVWLRPTDKANPFAFFLPKDAKIEVGDGVWFVGLEKTYLAIRPINLSGMAAAKLDEKAASDLAKNYPNAAMWSAAAGDGPYSGFAVEVGEGGSFEDFKQQAGKAKLDLADLARGKAKLTVGDGSFLELTHNSATDLPTVNRNGTPRDWDNPAGWNLWQTLDGELVSLGWKQGTLKVTAGGQTFESSAPAK